MSRSSRLCQQISAFSGSKTSQGLETISVNNIHPNLNLFSSTNTMDLFTEEKEGNNESNGKSLSQVSQRSNESTNSSCSMEVDQAVTIRCRRPTYLAISSPNNFYYHQVNQQEREINEDRITNNLSRSSSSDDCIPLLETHGVQTDMDFEEQHPLLDEHDDEEEEEQDDNDHDNVEGVEEFLHANSNQNGFSTLFDRL